MPATELSPNVENYFVGAGIVKWLPQGAGAYRDVGNASKFEFSSAVTRLKHYSSRTPTRIKDADVVTQLDAKIAISMDEVTAANLAMVLLGTEAPGSGTAGTGSPSLINIGTNTNIQGAFRMVGTNEFGAKIQVDLPNCTITPTGALGLINNGAWAEIMLEAEVNGDPTTGSLGQLAWGITDEIVYNGL